MYYICRFNFWNIRFWRYLWFGILRERTDLDVLEIKGKQRNKKINMWRSKYISFNFLAGYTERTSDPLYWQRMAHSRGTAHQQSVLNLLTSPFQEAEMSTWGNPDWGGYKNHQIKNWITNVKNAAVHFTLEKEKNAQLLADLYPSKV